MDIDQPAAVLDPDPEPGSDSGSLPEVRRPEAVRVSFTGAGAEYFRIWIVNLALTVATLGIYSAWAKVRRLQYFYRNTRLAGSSFDYHGEPIAILKGRIVGVALFSLYTFAGVISPFVALAVAAAIASVMPWLLSRSLRFRLHNSSYRGLRFRFSGSTSSAYRVFLWLPLLTLASLFTAGPFWHHRLKEYQHVNASYGGVPFEFDAPVSRFYRTYFLAALIGLGFLVLMGVGIAVASVAAIALNADAIAAQTDQPPPAVVAAIMVPILVIYFIAVLTLHAFIAARVRNLAWNHTTIGPHHFGSDLRARRLLWITLSNAVATLFTLGLFRPFAQVRLARYATSTLWMQPAGPLDEFAAGGTSEIDAVGEEVAELFDFDIAF